MGLYAAYRYFDPEMEKLFLGIQGRRYIGGRLGNYTDEPEKTAGPVCAALERMKELIETVFSGSAEDPFALIPFLMKYDSQAYFVDQLQFFRGK